MQPLYDPETGLQIDLYELPRRPTSSNLTPMRPGEKPAGFGRPRLWEGKEYAHPKYTALDHRPPRLCEGCSRRQSRPGRLLCQPCRANADKYGHPAATRHLPVRTAIGSTIAAALRVIEYVQKLPAGDPARTALDHAIHWLRIRLDVSRKYTRTPWRPWQPAALTVNRRLATLARHDVTPEKILAHVAGFIWARDWLPAMLRDQRHLVHQLGRAVLTLVPVPHPWRAQEPEPLGAQGVSGVRPAAPREGWLHRGLPALAWAWRYPRIAPRAGRQATPPVPHHPCTAPPAVPTAGRRGLTTIRP
jgi:hypothetical protein